MSYAVIDGGVPNSDAKASSDGSALTRQSVNFSYVSFGFASATGTKFVLQTKTQSAFHLFANHLFHQVHWPFIFVFSKIMNKMSTLFLTLMLTVVLRFVSSLVILKPEKIAIKNFWLG